MTFCADVFIFQLVSSIIGIIRQTLEREILIYERAKGIFMKRTGLLAFKAEIDKFKGLQKRSQNAEHAIRFATDT